LLVRPSVCKMLNQKTCVLVEFQRSKNLTKSRVKVEGHDCNFLGLSLRRKNLKSWLTALIPWLENDKNSQNSKENWQFALLQLVKDVMWASVWISMQNVHILGNFQYRKTGFRAFKNRFSVFQKMAGITENRFRYKPKFNPYLNLDEYANKN